VRSVTHQDRQSPRLAVSRKVGESGLETLASILFFMPFLPYAPKCVEEEFCEVRGSKHPTRVGP
jgi:hypothetical protein